MENYAKDLMSLMQYLLPGFLAAWIFYSFTSFAKPSQFERVIQALIFTLIIQAIVSIENIFAQKFFCVLKVESWTDKTELLFSIITALIFGVVLSYFANNDKFHKLARKLHITRETSFPSEWFGALVNSTYIVLHLEDERRILGWATEWPSEPDKGHFILEEASWLVKEEEIPLTGVKSILIDASDVKWVEIMEKKGEKENGQKSS